MDVEITHAFLSYEDKISCEGVMILLGKELDFFGRHRTTTSHTDQSPWPASKPGWRVWDESSGSCRGVEEERDGKM